MGFRCHSIHQTYKFEPLIFFSCSLPLRIQSLVIIKWLIFRYDYRRKSCSFFFLLHIILINCYFIRVLLNNIIKVKNKTCQHGHALIWHVNDNSLCVKVKESRKNLAQIECFQLSKNVFFYLQLVLVILCFDFC